MECKLRQWQITDAPELATMMNNKKIQNNLRDGIPYPYTLSDAKEFIESMLQSDPDQVYAYAITADNAVVGSIGLFRQSNIHSRTAEMGYYIAEPYWGKGLGTSAIKQACAHIFQTTDILRIFAEPFAENKASCRILEKSGFQAEGILRKNAVKNGNIIDMKLYSILKQDLQQPN